MSELIRQIRDLGGLFSVRNDGRLEWLQKDIGNTATNSVWEIPDPGLFVPIVPTFHPQICGRHRNIVLQLAGNKLPNRLMSDSGGRPARQDAVSVWDTIANVCNKVKKKHDVNFIIAPHVYSDFRATRDFISAAQKIPAPQYLTGSRLEVSGVLRGTGNASGFFDLYRQADMVVGMRGHSMIVSVGVGTPCIGIISQPKVEGFLKHCCLEKWSTNIANDNLEESLFLKVDALLDDSSEWGMLRASAVEKMVEKRKLFHCEIKRLLE